LAISLSVVLLLGIAVWVLHRYAGLKFWHAAICVLFGFYLAATTAAPAIRHVMHSIVALIPGQH
jgi:hypothetical protein